MNKFNKLNDKNSKLIKIFTKIPTLETPRLIMRRLRVNDYKDMYEYSRLESVTRYLLWSPHKDEEYTYRYLEHVQDDYRAGEFYDWALVYKEHDKMIGTCGFTRFDLNNSSAEIGYVLNPYYWGVGLAPEAVSEVIRFGFEELKLNRIEARYIYGNNRSRHVMEKCGMTFEGMFRSQILNKNEYKDVGVCSILSREYLNNKETELKKL